MVSKRGRSGRHVRGAAWLGAVDIATLVDVAKNGGARELEALLAAVRPGVVRYLARRVDAACADDLAQGVLWTVAREFRSVEVGGASAWLATVVRNVLRDEYRRRAWVCERFTDARAADGVVPSERVSLEAEERELRRVVTRATQAACGPAVRAVVAGILDGLTVRDIADASGVSVQAVRMRLARARAVLGPMLRPLLDIQSATPRASSAHAAAEHVRKPYRRPRSDD